ncbi:MAG TPA: ABC transporter ATP-binding protein [Candidatus Limnocylindria bacterium]
MDRTPVTLTLADVHVGYQPGIDVLQGIDLSTNALGVTTVIGPNGAGKSTLLRAIFGFLAPHTGRITLGDTDITGLAPNVVKRRGVSYITQGINIFPGLSVEENLRMGAWTIRGDRRRLRAQLDTVFELFPMLRNDRSRKASELSGGQAKMLSIAKEVMTEPSVILVDEPTAGLSPALSELAYEFLLRTHKSLGCSILLVDQNIEAAVAIADYVYLINLGRVKNEGPRGDFGPQRVRALIQECLTG